MGESDLHREVMFDTIETLKRWYAGRQVYVTGNLLLFYREGHPRTFVVPDVMVAKGLDQRPRENYLLWREGVVPQVVIEVTSRTTRREDQRKKVAIYRDDVRVQEYFLFDPRSEYLRPSLQGFRRVGSDFESIAAEGGRLPSVELELSLERDGQRLRLWNPATGKWLATPSEAVLEAERRRIEAERRSLEAEHRQSEADAQIRRLQDELRQLRDQN